MRRERIWRLQAIALLSAVTIAFAVNAAHAQVLSLSEPAQPPALDRFTFANHLVGRLEREIAERMSRERVADPMAQLALQASVNVRVIAAELLTAADAQGANGSQAALAGLTLAQGRDDIDATLDELVALAARLANNAMPSDADQQRLRQAVQSLRLFNDRAASDLGLLRDPNAESMHRTLSAMCMPLGEAVSAIDRSAFINHWIARTHAKPTPAMAVRAQPLHPTLALVTPRTLAQLRQDFGSLSLRDDTRTEIAAILDYLERGSAFADLRPQIEMSLLHMSQAAELLASLDKATWLKPAATEAYRDRLHLGVVLFKDPRTRERGQRHLDALEASRDIMDRITALMTGNARMKPLCDAFLAFDVMVENPAQAELGQAQLRQLKIVLERMLAYRDLGKVELRRDLQTIERQLDMMYRDAEARLLKEIDTLITNDGALTDPAFASLMQDQAHLLDDIVRVRRTPAWVDAIRLIDPESAGPFHAQTRKMAAWLLDSNRRPDALRAMDQFEQQLELFYPLPFEAEVRAGSAEAIAATGGMHERLNRRIDELRQDWARAWADGDAGSEHANHLLLLHRLMQIMADTASLIASPDAPAALNRWSAWELGATVAARTMRDVPNRLKLATAAAVQQDVKTLRSQLEEIDRDAPVVKLIGRLAQVIGESASALPAGSIGCVSQLALAPQRDAWWLHQRTVLAALCRYQTEAEYARITDREELLTALTEYVNALADDLLAQLGEQRSAIPTLIGFDGSDPNPEVETPDMPRRRR